MMQRFMRQETAQMYNRTHVVTKPNYNLVRPYIGKYIAVAFFKPLKIVIQV